MKLLTATLLAALALAAYAAPLPSDLGWMADTAQAPLPSDDDKDKEKKDEKKGD